MTFHAITAAVPDGIADGRLAVPEGAGPFPLVVFIADAGGLRASMDTMARRLVDAGYAVLQPDPYWRHGDYRPFDAMTVFSDPPERARLMGMVATVRAEALLLDTEALIAAIDDPRVEHARIGVVGYCMGGRMAFIIAAQRPQRVVAAAVIHAGGLVNDSETSPHRMVGTMRAALYLGVADEDGGCTPEHQAALRGALDAAEVRYELEVYPGARHGFAVPDFPVYDRAAAEKHWERVLALFAAHLR